MAVPSFLLFAFLLFAPESPRWLIARHRRELAFKILERINGRDEAERELG